MNVLARERSPSKSKSRLLSMSSIAGSDMVTGCGCVGTVLALDVAATVAEALCWVAGGCAGVRTFAVGTVCVRLTGVGCTMPGGVVHAATLAGVCSAGRGFVWARGDACGEVDDRPREKTLAVWSSLGVAVRPRLPRINADADSSSSSAASALA